MVSQPRIPILMYHRIGRRVANSIVRDQYVPEHLLDRQLAFLSAKGFRSISLGEMKSALEAGSNLDRPVVVITFDDGYRSFYTSALPLLRKHGMMATVFLVSDCVGCTNRWDEAKGDVSEPLMTIKEIQESTLLGMHMGAHTRTHPDLRFCDDALAQEEIALCKTDLESSLQAEIRWFSYPFGKSEERDRRLVREAGYLGACGTDKHVNSPKTDPFSLGRINVRATTIPRYLLRKLRVAERNV